VNALDRMIVSAVVALAPAAVRESLHGDLLEDNSRTIRECLRSALPLTCSRLRQAGPTRVALACAAALLGAGLVHGASEAAFRFVLDAVPLRAWHAASFEWRAATGAFEIAGALLGAATVVASGLARKGTPP
jgi:hypothetical protein